MVLTGALIVIAFAISILTSRSARAAEGRARRRKLSDRVRLDPITIYRSAIKDMSIDDGKFFDAWNAIARILRVNPVSLRPDDSFTDLDVGTWWFINDLYFLDVYLQSCAVGREALEIRRLTNVLLAVQFVCRDRKK